MAAKQQVVSIDIGSSSVKAVHLEQSAIEGEELVIRRVSVAEYPARQVGGIPESEENQARDSITEAIKSIQIPKKASVVLSISRSLLTTRQLEGLPIEGLNNPAQLDNIVNFQAEEVFPFRLDEIVFDHYKAEEKANSLSVELVAARRSDVAQLLAPLKTLNLTPKAVMPSMIAVSALTYQSASTEGQSPVNQPSISPERNYRMIVDIGAGWTDLFIVQSNVRPPAGVVFSRSFSLGGDHLTSLLQNQADNQDTSVSAGDPTSSLEAFSETTPTGQSGSSGQSSTTFETAEAKKQTLVIPSFKGRTIPDITENSEGAIGAWCQRLEVELRRSISAFQRDQSLRGDEKDTGVEILPDQIWLTGGSSRISGLAEHLTNALSIPTMTWDLPATLQTHGISFGSDLLDISDQVAIAVGQGIYYLREADSDLPVDDLNLLPRAEIQQIQRVDQQRRLMVRVAAGIAIVALLAVGAISWGQYQQTQVTAVEREIQQLSSSFKRAQKVLTQELAVTELITPKVSALDLVREFSLRLIDRTKVAFTSFQITKLDDLAKARLAFGIEANSHQDISNLVTTLNQSGIFKDIKQGQIVSVNKDRKNFFQVQITCSIKAGAVRTLAEHRYKGTGLQPSAIDVADADNDAEQNRERENDDGEQRSESTRSREEKSSDERRARNSYAEEGEGSWSGNKESNQKSSKSSKSEERAKDTKRSERDMEREERMAKELLPSGEEYEQMDEREQAEVRAAKARIYRDDGSTDFDEDDK